MTFYSPCGAATQRGSWPHFLRFLDHIQRRTTVGRTPLDKWSARRRDLYLTTHNTHNRQTSLPPVGFERPISAGERPQNHALDHTATGTSSLIIRCYKTVLFIYLEVEFILLMQAHLRESTKIPDAFCMFWYTFLFSLYGTKIYCMVCKMAIELVFK